MGGRVVEGARLESVYRIKNSIEGSNPSPSAKYHLPLLNDATEFIARLRRFSQSKFHFDFEDDSATGTASPSLLVPLFAKNSRLGYFFNANNLTQTRLQIQSPDLRLEAVFMRD